MFYDIVLCECACGNRIAFPAKDEAAVLGFVCDECFLSYQFGDESRPSRMGLGDDEDNYRPTGFLVFSLIRSHQELGEEVFESWFGSAPRPDDELPLTGTDG